MDTPQKILGVGAVIAAAVLWGTTGTMQTLLPQEREPLAVGALRLILGALILLAIALTRRESRRGFSALPWRAVIWAGLCISLYNLLFFWAVSEAGVGIGTAIAIGSAPVWATLIEVLVSRRWPDRIGVLGQVLAISGAVLLAIAGGAGGASALGIGLAALAGLCYAAYSLATSGIGRCAPSSTVAAATFCVSAALAAPVLLLLPLGWLASAESVMAILFLGVCATAVAYTLYTWGLRHVAASTAVTLALAEPVTAWVLATIVVGEVITLEKLLGAVLVLAGLATMTVVATRPGASRGGRR